VNNGSEVLQAGVEEGRFGRDFRLGIAYQENLPSSWLRMATLRQMRKRKFWPITFKYALQAFKRLKK
jgi:hypothetical protein